MKEPMRASRIDQAILERETRHREDARSWDHPTHPLLRMMIYTYVLDRGPAGVRSQLDGL